MYSLAPRAPPARSSPEGHPTPKPEQWTQKKEPWCPQVPILDQPEAQGEELTGHTTVLRQKTTRHPGLVEMSSPQTR